MTQLAGAITDSKAKRVLVIDDDRDITDLVHAILTDEGFAVSVLHDQRPEAIRMVVNQLEPDCVLLDGESPKGYGESWGHASWMSGRDRRVPLIMFTGHRTEVREADGRTSDRSKQANFVGIVEKPFDLDVLVTAVSNAVGLATPFALSEDGERARTQALIERLQAAGAREIHVSTRREWANFETQDGAFVQVYWWQRDGVYYVARYATTGGRIETIGRFFDLEAAISVGVSLRS